MREKLFSVTSKDCTFIATRGSGAGGQKRNKTSSAIRCVHEKSGAVGECESHREQSLNKKEAFRKMAESSIFKKWLDLESKKVSGDLAIIEAEIDKQMKRVVVEVKNESGLWEKAGELSE